MKNTLLIITANSAARIGLQTYLASLFSNYLTIDSIRADDVTPDILETASYILYSSLEVKNALSVPVPATAHQVVCMRTFNHTYIHKVLQIPPGAYVYLVNDTGTSACEVIRQLQDFGITQYHFLPFYPGCGPASPDIQYAVTMGELHLVPRNIPTVIDMGNRVPDISTINEIIAFFHLPTGLADKITRIYINHIVQILKLSNTQLTHALDTRHITQIIIDNVAGGICLMDSDNNIRMINPPFARMLCLHPKNPVGSNLSSLLTDSGIFCDLQKSGEYHLENNNGRAIGLWIQEIDTIDTSHMYLLHTHWEAENTPPCPDNPLPAGQELHSFGHIITKSPQVLRLLEHAKRISLNDFHMVLQGENGTEKEMLAQAIHSNSRRHDGPFITLNLISMEASTVERSLLGYEGGVFSGARTEGQKGILEDAAKGTLFIKGIQYMSLPMQGLLLSVLQNGYIKKIGSEETIPINLRIIASATADLYPLVLKGSFLDELFFMLNSVSLVTVPLRQRKEDIPLLLNYFLRNIFNDPSMTMEDILSENLCIYLQQYSWPGNAQEIHNLCKYFSCIYSRRLIGLQELPAYMINQITGSQIRLSPWEREILQVISDNPRVGRSSIQQQLAKKEYSMSEGKIRSILHTLSESGYIEIHRTRGGCEVTELGRLILQGPDFPG